MNEKGARATDFICIHKKYFSHFIRTLLGGLFAMPSAVIFVVTRWNALRDGYYLKVKSLSLLSHHEVNLRTGKCYN